METPLPTVVERDLQLLASRLREVPRVRQAFADYRVVGAQEEDVILAILSAWRGVITERSA